MSAKKLTSLSIFFPCYNEEKNIPIFVEEAFRVLPTVARKFEVIIINDGSRDNTLKITKKLQKQHAELRLVNHAKNRGYGASLKTGFQHAQYDWVFFTDGDLQFSLQELAKFVSYTNDYEVIIGYRKKRADGAMRSSIAKIYKLFIDMLFRLGVKDIDCAYKLFSKRVLNLVTLESEGAFISAELLYKLKKQQVKFRQLPVNHFLRKFGSPTGNNFDVVLKAGKESLKLYLHMKFGLF